MCLKPSVHRLLGPGSFTLEPTDPVVPLDASILNVPSLQEFRTALNTLKYQFSTPHHPRLNIYTPTTMTKPLHRRLLDEPDIFSGVKAQRK
jgi:hypothetical protein